MRALRHWVRWVWTFGGRDVPDTQLQERLQARGLSSEASHVFQTMVSYVQSWHYGDEGFKERLHALTVGESWNARDSYEGMHPPQDVVEDTLMPVESVSYFEIYIVFQGDTKVPFAQFINHMKVAAEYYLEKHPREADDVATLMTAFEASVTTLQKNHDHWMAAQ